jgi:hypothetical protein
MSQGKKLTSAQQQRILDLKADGSSVRATAEKLELSSSTVQAVCKRGTVKEPEPPPQCTKAEDVTELKREMIRRWRDKEEEILEAMTNEKIAAMNGRDLAVAAGIGSDKLRQWTGLDRDGGPGLTVHIPAELLDSLRVGLIAQLGRTGQQPITTDSLPLTPGEDGSTLPRSEDAN